MNFPYIQNISDILPRIQDNPQFRVAPQPNGTTVICYMLQDEDTFKGENEKYAQECRGITFDTATGAILSRTLHKFENVGQSADSQPENIPWERITRVMDKRDGSMITFVLIDGKVVGKTKKTFTSNEAIAATEFLHQDKEKLAWVTRCLEGGQTATFEWTSPRFPIVLTYKEDALTLLHVRDNVTGEYDMDIEWWESGRGGLCPFPIVENIINEFMWKMGGEDSGLPYTEEFDWSRMKHAAETREGIEGWIVQADDGRMWKVKTLWYIKLHHSVTFTRWRDVARTVAEDQSDDLKAAFATTGRSIEPILQVERAMKDTIDVARFYVNEKVQHGLASNLTPKEMALAYKGHENFNLIMKQFRGQEINWLEWYAKNHVDSWSLEVIPTVVEEA